MKQLLAIAIIFFSTQSISVFAQAKPDVITLSKIAIQFPDKAIYQNQEPYKIYRLELADSTAKFQAIEIDLTKLTGLSIETLAAAQETNEFWDQAKQGILNTLGKDIKLVKDAFIQVKGNKVLEMFFESKNTKGELSTVKFWMFTKDGFSYQMVHTKNNNLANEKMGNDFFDSLVIK